MRHAPSLSAGLLAAGLLSACADQPAAPAHHDRLAQPIVNGRVEAGWAGVGALTYESRNTGYIGSFCTGALIGSRWVLTASHCIRGLQSEGLQVSPSNVSFYTGPDARGSFNGPPNNGAFYPVRQIHLHPGYDADDYVALYDIALLELSVAAAEPVYPYFTGDLTPYEGRDVFYVGYGASNGDTGEGGGVKRSTSLPLVSVTPGAFVSDHQGSGVCQGDSGGPAFLQIDGQWQIIGVNNSVAGAPACLDLSIQIQTASHAHWIQQVMGLAGACGANTCACPEACGADGLCDALACNDQASCGEIFDCFNTCQGEGCEFACYADGSVQGRAVFDTALQCITASCANAADYQGCVESACGDELALCFDGGAPATGEADCEAVLTCVNACDGAACQRACYAAGTAGAQRQYDDLISCVFDRCDGLDGEAFNDCAYGQCGDLWAACLPGDGCDVSGGDCGPGAACVPGQWPATFCEPANDRARGQLCNPQVVDCADGLLCVDEGFGTRCEALCVQAEDCPEAGATCDLIEGAAVTVGICQCVDEDRDGACAAADCDDHNGRRRPDADEICDEIDNDCDDRVDEGCGAGGAGGGMMGGAGGDGGEMMGGAGGAVGGSGGLLPDAGPGGGSPDGGAPGSVSRVSRSDGGGCDALGAQRPGVSPWLWLLIGLPWLRRRR